MKIIYAVWELATEILEWPLGDNGRTSFKLDRLAYANGFVAHKAHDALGDFEATIHKAGIICDRAPTIWKKCVCNRDKRIVSSILKSGQSVQLIERFGADTPRSFIGVYAGTNLLNRNVLVFLDLEACKAEEIVDAADDVLADSVTTSPKIIRTIYTNKVPNIFLNAKKDPIHVAEAKIVSSRPDFYERVRRALSNRFVDYEVSAEVEDQIYCSFYSALDKIIFEKFLVSSWTHRSKLVNKLNDKRLRQLGQRLIYLNLPEIVSDRYKSAAKTVIRERWLTSDIDVPWMTMAKVEKQLLEIEAAGAINAQFCSQLQRYYKNKKVL